MYYLRPWKWCILVVHFCTNLGFHVEGLKSEIGVGCCVCEMSTALAHKRCDDTSLKDEVERHWREIIKHSYRFEQQQKEVPLLVVTLHTAAPASKNTMQSHG